MIGISYDEFRNLDTENTPGSVNAYGPSSVFHKKLLVHPDT